MNDPNNQHNLAACEVTWPRSVVIVESPSANLNSIYIALKRIQNVAIKAEGSPCPRFSLKLSRDPQEILKAERVIFPGVGHAAYVMAELRRSGLYQVLQQVQSPIMGICLGMQLLFEQLSEDGEYAGLGLLPGKILPLRPALSKDATQTSGADALAHEAKFAVPHMGWNHIEARRESSFSMLVPETFTETACYFVHSYYLPRSPLTVASCFYGNVEISAIVRGQDEQGKAKHIWGCQFHPEKSGRFGAEILKNWLLCARA